MRLRPVQPFSALPPSRYRPWARRHRLITSSTAITAPSETLSPTLTFNSLITPAALEGISIVALSDSSVTRPWSFATVSPALTSSSITGTLSWPPMSGTLISIVFAIVAPPSEQQPAQVAELGAR